MTTPEQLPGRATEFARVSAWLDEAAAGRSVIGTLEGDAGIGKSTLAAAARDEAGVRSFTVLATQGRAADAEIGFSSLLTLLRPFERELDDLAGDAADDVRAALALGRRDADPIRVQLGVFRIVAALAERAPVLVVVDDADQLDAATARALAFAFGRLDADRVCALMTSDGDLAEELAALPRHELTLGPLDHDALVAAVTARAELDGTVLAEVIRLASGNPLAAIELAGSLSDDERNGHTPFPGVPRPSAAMRRGFESRLAAAPEAARRALAVVAADDIGDAAVITTALAHLGESGDGLSEAEACGLLVREGTRVRLVHPLLRAVAYHQVAPASRRAAHRALAAALDRPDQAAPRAWQLAAAAEGPDELAANALALVADDALRRGGPGSAARTLEQAAVLTPDPRIAQHRLAEAALLWQADDPARARTVAERIVAPLDADVAAVLAEVAGRVVQPPAGYEAHYHALLAEHALGRGDDRTAEAEAHAAGTNGDPALLAGAVLVQLGRTADVVVPSTPGVGAFAAYAWRTAQDARVAAGYVDGERAAFGSDLASVLRTARIDLLQGRAQAAADRVRVRVELGAGDEAILVLREAELLLGRVEAAAEGVDAVLGRAEQAGDARLTAYASWLLGRVTGAEGALARAATLCPAHYGADAVAALTTAGRSAPARALAEQLTGVESAGPLPRARALRARATADISRDGYEAALATCDDHGLVVEAIEILLASGAVDDARARARMTDVRLFDQRTAPVRREKGLRDQLSAAELRVAEVVASGLTNRQAAESLFLSVKTVDFHLQQIYRKLGVNTRTQLAVLVSRDIELAAPRPGGTP